MASGARKERETVRTASTPDEPIEIPYYGIFGRRGKSFEQALEEVLVGQSIYRADNESHTLTLSNGVQLRFEESNSSCCSWVELNVLRGTDSIITKVTVDDDCKDGTGAYKAWIHVLTEAGELNIAEANGDASNGYYLSGFALSVTVTLPPAGEDEALDAIRRSMEAMR